MVADERVQRLAASLDRLDFSAAEALVAELAEELGLRLGAG